MFFLKKIKTSSFIYKIHLYELINKMNYVMIIAYRNETVKDGYTSCKRYKPQLCIMMKIIKSCFGMMTKFKMCDIIKMVELF